ncbi:hypothetical protein HK101_002302 [Irineochytrium annulatum]|nr:hypothetical protein HK101_002302 [Irineochytrium annulatum]
MSDDEEDYMSAAVLNAAVASHKASAASSKASMTYAEKRRRDLEASRQKGAVKPLWQREKEARDEGLSTTVLKDDNKGFQMLAKLGFKKGMTLGKSDPDPVRGERLAEPIPIVLKSQRTGVGISSHAGTKRPRPAAEGADGDLAEIQLDERGYRAKVGRKMEDRRTAGELIRARRTVRSLDEAAGVGPHEIWPPEPVISRLDDGPGGGVMAMRDGVTAARHVEEEEYEREVIEVGEAPDAQDSTPLVEEEAAFEAMEPEDQLRSATKYLREAYFYCLWCGDRFKDAKELAELCPGPWRDDHDDLE